MPAFLAALLALAVAAPTAAAAQNEPPLRPGSVFHVALPTFDNSCTVGFLLRGRAPGGHPDRDDLRDYFATSGHCLFVDAEATEEVHAAGAGPRVFRTARSTSGAAVPGPRIGEVVYAAQTVPVQFPDENLPEFMDLGLILLDEGVATNPAVCHFGGPTALRRSVPETPQRFSFYGSSNALGHNRETGTTVLPARSAIASAGVHPHVLTGAFPSSGGDSGSPILDAQGRAVALLSGPYQPRLAPMLPRAEAVLGTKLRLQTAPAVPSAGPVGVDAGCTPATA